MVITAWPSKIFAELIKKSTNNDLRWFIVAFKANQCIFCIFLAHIHLEQTMLFLLDKL